MDSDSSQSPGNARRSLLSVFAVVSLVAIGILASGYFTQAVPAFRYNRLAGPQYVTFADLNLGSGRIELWFIKAPSNAAVPTGFQIFWPQRFQISGHDLLRSLWEFDTRSSLFTNGSRTFLFAFPIWCAAAPFLIAPIIWLRRRRRGRDAGFPVVQTGDLTRH
jgi:hypothetical protein